MKTARKAKPAHKPVRRTPPLSLTMRVERLEKQLLFKDPPIGSSPGIPKPRFFNLGADGKSTAGDHVAVFDSETGLTWSAGPLQGGADLSHADAMKACADLELLGKKDWRAPTIKELLSIVDYERVDPAVDTAHFKGPYGWTWSSTLAKAPAGCAWFVFLNCGSSGRSYQGNLYRVRAVRSGQQLGLLG